MQKNFNISFYI